MGFEITGLRLPSISSFIGASFGSDSARNLGSRAGLVLGTDLESRVLATTRTSPIVVDIVLTCKQGRSAPSAIYTAINY